MTTSAPTVGSPERAGGQTAPKDTAPARGACDQGGRDSTTKRGRYGAANGRWRGADQLIATEGYVRVRVGHGHPLAHADGYAYAHDVVWAAAGRRAPEPHELIHHVSGDKTDNRLDNLEIVTRADHSRMHAATQPRVRGRFARVEVAG